jgi:hypothetical protein
MSYWHKLVLFGTGILVADNGTPAPAPSEDWFNWHQLVRQIFSTVVFLLIGLAFFALSDWLVERILPRSLRKGIEEDKNVALAIVIAAVILGVALIVSAAIRG